MEMRGNHGFENSNICNGDIQGIVEYKIMQFSADQVMVLEKIFLEYQNPSLAMMLSMISRNSALSNLDYLHIQAWFEHRRYLEHKKKEAIVLNFLNERKDAHERLMLLENEYLQGKVQHLSMENAYSRKLLNYVSLESYLPPEMPRSIFKNSKVVAARRLTLLRNELHENEVQQLQRENEYVRNLEEHINDTRARINALVNSLQNSSGTANNTRGLLLFARTVKFPPKTPSALSWVLIPRVKFDGVNEIYVNTRSDLTYFPVKGITVDASVMLSFMKAAMLPDVPLDFFYRQKQEFVVCFTLKDIKLDQIFFKNGEKSLTAIVPAFLSLEIQISFKEEEDSLTAFSSAFLPQDIKLDKIAFKDGEESLAAVVPALFPQRFCVMLGRYRVLGAWRFAPNGQAAGGDVKFMLHFKSMN